jgi:hypothetical protein
MRQPKGNPEAHPLCRIIWRGLRYLRETGDRFTRGPTARVEASANLSKHEIKGKLTAASKPPASIVNGRMGSR